MSDQWSLPTDVQYVNLQIAYAWHSARPTCGRRSTKSRLSSKIYADKPPTSAWFFWLIYTRALADRPSFSLRVCLSRAFRRCLFEYMYNPLCTILGMRLQGTAHSSEEIELQRVMIWFLINCRIRVLSHDHSCVGDVKRYSVGKICVVICVVDCVECVWRVNPAVWGFLYPF